MKINYFLGISFLLVILAATPVMSQESEKADSLSALNLPSPKGAMIRSALFPGWGQWYNGKKRKAAAVFLAESGIVGAVFYWNRKAQQATTREDQQYYLENRNLSIWYLGGAILLSMADAFVDAHLAGFDVSPDLSWHSGDRHWQLAFTWTF